MLGCVCVPTPYTEIVNQVHDSLFSLSYVIICEQEYDSIIIELKKKKPETKIDASLGLLFVFRHPFNMTSLSTIKEKKSFVCTRKRSLFYSTRHIWVWEIIRSVVKIGSFRCYKLNKSGAFKLLGLRVFKIEGVLNRYLFKIGNYLNWEHFGFRN